MSDQAGFLAERTDKTSAELTPRLMLECDAVPDHFELAVQIPTKALWRLWVNGAEHACVCRDSPTAPGAAAYVECAQPEAPIRLRVSPGDVVRLRLCASWEDTRHTKREQTVFDGHFTAPLEVHRMGSPGYQLYVPHVGALCYLCVGNVGTPSEYHMEILSFHMTLVY
jgi:hypothetical protein